MEVSSLKEELEAVDGEAQASREVIKMLHTQLTSSQMEKATRLVASTIIWRKLTGMNKRSNENKCSNIINMLAFYVMQFMVACDGVVRGGWTRGACGGEGEEKKRKERKKENISYYINITHFRQFKKPKSYKIWKFKWEILGIWSLMVVSINRGRWASSCMTYNNSVYSTMQTWNNPHSH